MVKIKKYIYKLLTVVLAFLVVFNMSAVGVLAEGENSNAVTPEAEDYSISGGTITGLKSTYLSKLTEEQKQNIRLVIPEKIGESKVTAIGEYAFSQYNSRPNRYIYLDLSRAQYLETIKSYAFRSDGSLTGTINLPNGITTIETYAFGECPLLSGDLDLPDSLNTIGTHAFDGCAGLTGTLKLSSQLKTISDYAFNNCGFTGELIIPDGVTKISDSAFRQSKSYNGFSGTLSIPASVSSIGKIAFAYQSAITKLDLSKCSMTSFGDSAFKDMNGLQGVLTISEKIQNIGDKAFYGAGYSTIYLPSNIILGDNVFKNCNGDVIVPTKDEYDRIGTSKVSKLTYSITVTFDDGNSGSYSTKECLYNRPYNYEKDSEGVWKANTAYKFPAVLNAKNKAWGSSPTATAMIKETDIATATTLYAITALVKPEITYSENIDREYDGKPVTLKVTATHPSAHTYKGAKPGDVLFYYRWYWDTITPREYEQEGFDLATYDFTDVREPRFAIGCSVDVISYIVGDDYKATYFDVQTHTFSVDLRQAEPTVNPVVEQKIVYDDENTGTLPEIKLSDGDTKGTISFDKDQTLKDGFGTYKWSFTPEENTVGSSNYKAATGEVTIYCAKKDLTATDLSDKITALPDITGENPTIDDEQKTSILDAFLTFETSNKEIQEALEVEKQNKIFETVKKLPNIEVIDATSQGAALDNTNDLVRNITTEDILAMKDSDQVRYNLKLSAEKADLAAEEAAAIQNKAGDMKLAGNYDVKLIKTVTVGTDEKIETVSKTNHPIKLVFDVPENLKSSAANQEFYIIRTHTDNNGVITAERLQDEDTNPLTITVSSDMFSSYTIAYKEKSSSPDISGPSTGVLYYDITASAGEHGTISPADKVSVVYGGNKTFSFQPETGYKVGDVLVDGVSVGSPSSYTFENVKAAHSIQVLFTAADSRLITGVENTTLKLTSKVGKGYIRLSWKKSLGYKVDYYQVYKSTKKNSGYGSKAYYTTKNGVKTFYKNTKGLKKGTRYYYKARGVRLINNQKYYTKWSNKTWRIAK